MILLLGATGYVGRAFQSALTARGLPFRAPVRADWSPQIPGRLGSLLDTLRPTWVVHCAGYTGKPNVDACELHKADCLFGNALLPSLVKEACDRAAIPWAHVSSGCIFTGDNHGRGFSETDLPNFTFRQNNCSFYSGTKALGEELLGYQSTPSPAGPVWASSLPETGYILRLRMPFNHLDEPRNLLAKLAAYPRLLDARNSLSHLGEFVGASLDLLQRRAPFGIYNITNPGSITTREITELMSRSGKFSKTFAFFSNEEEFLAGGTRTPRSNCVLDTSKLAALGIHLRPVHEAVALALAEWTIPARTGHPST